PAPAHASMTGMQKCQAHQPPSESWQFTQAGNVVGISFPGGPNPPNGIFPGNALHVIVNDSATTTTMVNIATWWPEWYGIAGNSEPATSGYPFPGWPKYADYFRMNNNPGGWVASGSDPNPWNPHPLRELNATPCFAAPNIPVRMGTQINDDNIGDNQGSWKFT